MIVKKLLLVFVIIVLFSSCNVFLSFKDRVNTHISLLKDREITIDQFFDDISGAVANIEVGEHSSLRLLKYLKSGDNILHYLLHFHSGGDDATFTLGEEMFNFSKTAATDSADSGTKMNTKIYISNLNAKTASIALSGGGGGGGDNPAKFSINKQVLFRFAEGTSGGFQSAVVSSGYLDFLPANAGLDLRGADVTLEGNDPDTGLLITQTLTVRQADNGEWRRFSLQGNSLEAYTSVGIDGDVLVNASALSGGSITIQAVPAINRFAWIKLRPGVAFEFEGDSLQILDFGLKDGPPEKNYAAWFYGGTFRRLGVKLQFTGAKIAGLDYSLQIPLLNLNTSATTGIDKDYVELVNENVNFEIVDVGGTQKIFGVSGKIENTTPINRDLTLYDVPIAEYVTITVSTQFDLIIDIDRAILNLNKVPEIAGYLGPAYPKAEEQPDGLNLREQMQDLKKYITLPQKYRIVRPALYAYIQGAETLVQDTYLNLSLKYNNKEIQVTPGLVPIRTGAVVPDFSGTEFSGTLPPSVIDLDVGALIDMVVAEPEDLFMQYEVQFPPRTTINFSSAAGDVNTLRFTVDCVVDLPLDLELYADDSTESEFAYIKYTSITTGDAFGREDRVSPLGTLGAYATDVSVTIDLSLMNGLGITGAEYTLISTPLPGRDWENFRQKLGGLKTGANHDVFALKESEIPYPFIPGIELAFRADHTGPDGKYAVLRVNRDGWLNISLAAEVSAQIPDIKLR